MSFGNTQFRPPTPLMRTPEFRAPSIMSVSGAAASVTLPADARPVVVASVLPSKFTVGGAKKMSVKASTLASVYTYGGASKITTHYGTPKNWKFTKPKGGAFGIFAVTPFGQLSATIRLSRGY